MTIRFASVCAGIEAASVAWHPLGWTPAWFSEIAPFPCAVLAHHYPTVPNLGDMTRIDDARLAEHGPVDLLIGGTPCQSFSVAGLRKGLADPRGNLALVFLGLLDRMRPRWVVWENVPGVLSVDAGRAFGAFLGGLGQLGYGWSYRVLDAQYFGVAQRRRRVFVVGHLGGWQRAAAVLLESSSLRGDPAPSREAGAGVAGALDGGAHGGGFDGNDARAGKCVAVEEDNQNGTRLSETAGSIRANAPGTKPGGTLALVAHAIQDARDLEKKQNGLGVQRELAYTLDRAATQAVAFAQNQREEVRDLGDVAAAVKSPGTHESTFVAFQCHGSNVGPTGHLRSGNGNEAGGVPFGVFNWQSGGDGRGLDPRDTAQLQRCQVPAIFGTLEQVGYNAPKGGENACSQEADAAEILRVLRQEVGAEAVAEWGLGVLDSLRSPKVLRAAMHGVGVRRAAREAGCVVGDGASSRAEGLPEGPLRDLWQDGPDGRSSQGRQLAEQLARELGASLPLLPPAEAPRSGVRRLTPREAERLQGFPDDWTLVPYRGKPAADGPRYMALGNSMAVPVVRWIGERIELVESVGRG